MSSVVTYHARGNVGLITIDSPPVNALSVAVRQGLLDGLAAGLADEAVEALWKSLEPGLKKVAKGQTSPLDATQVQALVAQYQAHARYEEAEFLPLSQTILGRNGHHMAALGLSLHMRHAPINLKATYI